MNLAPRLAWQQVHLPLGLLSDIQLNSPLFLNPARVALPSCTPGGCWNLGDLSGTKAALMHTKCAAQQLHRSPLHAWPHPQRKGLCGRVGKRKSKVKEEDGTFLAVVVS